MEYKGKLYGKLNRITFPLLNTTDDWDKMEARIKELENKIKVLNQANDVEHPDSNCNIPLIIGICRGGNLSLEGKCKKYGGQCSRGHCDYYR